MSDSAPSTSLPHGTAPSRGRGRHALRWTAGVALLVIAALVAAAVVPSSHGSGDPAGHARALVATPSRGHSAPARETKVVDSSIPASRYAAVSSELDTGVDARGRYVATVSPVPARRFDGPIAAYRRYAERWARRLQRPTAQIASALRAGDRTAARRAWDRAFSDYLHLGAVYGLLPGTLNDRLAEVPSSTGDTRFPGLHRIEKGLWTGQPLRALVPVAVSVQDAVVALRRALPGVHEDPLDYATRAHEILEDAQRDLMSGADVPWSHEGVLGTAAGLTATRRVIATLTPLLRGREDTLGPVRYWLAQLSVALRAARRPDGTYPGLGGLSSVELRRIDAALAGACVALSAVPGSLETHGVPVIPAIPDHGGSR